MCELKIENITWHHTCFSLQYLLVIRTLCRRNHLQDRSLGQLLFLSGDPATKVPCNVIYFVKINTFISIAGRLKYAIASPHYNLIGHWQWKLYIYARAKIRAIVVSIGVSHMYRAAHCTRSLIIMREEDCCPQPPYLGFLFLLPFFTGLWLIDITSCKK